MTDTQRKRIATITDLLADYNAKIRAVKDEIEGYKDEAEEIAEFGDDAQCLADAFIELERVESYMENAISYLEDL